MIIFPLIYLSAFIFALRGIIKGEREEILLFLILGLPIYITSLCIAFDLGFGSFIGVLQSFKEAIIVTLLGIQLYTLKSRIRFHGIDYAVMAYFAYTFLYALFPIGEQNLMVRLLAFKSISFFSLVYFCGRLFDPDTIYISKYFHYILYLSIAASGLAIIEYLSSTHFQTLTGFADFYYYIYNFQPTGAYGLSWTFETDTGIMRFSSFFANPLEFAAATLLALSILAGLSTTETNHFKLNTFNIIVLTATLISIFLAFSRAAFLNYFLIIYVYALLTRKKYILQIFYACIICIVLYFLYLLNDEDIRDFVYATLNFTNSSSIGHLLEWIDGINSMIDQPMGLGLGTSGRVAASFNGNTGGENQFIIIGVQAGIIAMFIYLVIYFLLIRTCWKWFPILKGSERQVCLALLLMKIGFIIPLMTSELESSSYISYTTWFLSGFFISIITQRIKIQKIQNDKQLNLAQRHLGRSNF